MRDAHNEYLDEIQTVLGLEAVGNARWKSEDGDLIGRDEKAVIGSLFDLRDIMLGACWTNYLLEFAAESFNDDKKHKARPAEE